MSKKLIRFDWAIKRLLRNKANFVVLEGFLSELLFEDIKIEQILESESNQQNDEDKYNRVDILTKNSKGELIIIEIQNTYEIDYFHRMAYGVSKVMTENLHSGQSYSEVKKIISINIVYFDLGQGKDYIYKGATTFEGLHEKDILQLSNRQKETFTKQNVSDIFPEYYLIKVNQFNDVARDTLDEWIYFLKNSEVKDEFRAKGLNEAKEVLDLMRLNKKQYYGYNRYLDYLHYKASEALSLKIEQEEYMEKKIAEAEEKMKKEMERREEELKKEIERREEELKKEMERKEEELKKEIERKEQEAKKEIERKEQEAKKEMERKEQEAKKEMEKKLKEEVTEAEEKARKENAIKTAKNMITLGIDLDTVSKATGLSIQEIEKLLE